ncbi:MAG: indolepyruvate oxidoreductase subunit beta [Desulfobacterales bacterium]
MEELIKDPFSLIVIGVAGQGNVMTSFLVCNALINQGYKVTFSQTYPAQQRGGSVINYIRISKDIQASPIVPEGRADVIVGMEPMETMRMLAQYGNPDVRTIVNPRAIQPMDTTGQGIKYPSVDKLIEDITALSAKTWVVPATEEARKLGNPIIANVILAGALAGAGVVPLDREVMEPVLRERFPKAFDINMKAFDKGLELAGRNTG